MTATASYREIGRRAIEAEQKDRRRAGHGERLVERPSLDLTRQSGSRVQPSEPAADAFVLHGLANAPDSVWRISPTF